MAFIPQGRREAFHLRRYNGKSHYHTNWLDEKKSFYDFHIHQATEKYQKSAYKDNHYAERTDRYVQLDDALKCLLKDCKVITVTIEDTTVQGELF